MRTRTQGVERAQRDHLGTTTQYFYGSEILTPAFSPNYYTSSKTCLDEIHPRYPNEGGPFSIVELRQSFSDASMKTGYIGYNRNSGYVYDGNRRVIPLSTQVYPSDALKKCQDLGPEAWNKFKPKLAQVNLGQFFAEIKDVPSLLKFRLKKFKDLGSDYLNVEFGWKPFLSDLRNWYQSVVRLDRQIANLQKHNGKWLRRKGTLYENQTETEDQNCYLYWNNYVQTLSKRRTVVSTEKAWFSGSFRYYIPGLSDGKWGKLKAVQQLWGLEIDPALVYELTPFSWLVDWFSNVGDVISNYSSATSDNMVAKYAYIMRSTETVVTCTCNCKGTLNEYGKSPIYSYGNPRSICTTITKARAAASPYGFNLDIADFSNWQISILAALGMSYLK